jgi:hypothetical protein
MPSTFEKFGISFQYPDNWTLEQERGQGECKLVTVVSPGGAFWTVVIHPRPADPDAISRQVLETMKEEYEDLEAGAARETMVGRELVGYDMNFFYLDMTNSAQVRCLRSANRTYTIFYQAEDREFEKIEMVFRAITTSFLSNLVPEQ